MSVTIIDKSDIAGQLADLGITTVEGKKAVTQRVAELIAAAMEDYSPSRRLRDIIISEVLEETDDGIRIGVGPSDDPDAFIAHFLEFGTNSGGRFAPDTAQALSIEGGFYASAQHQGMAARPFIRPALDENIDQAIEEAAQEFKDLLGV